MATAVIPGSWQAHDEKVRPYVRGHRRLGWARRILGLSLFGWFLLSRQAWRLDEAVGGSWILFFLIVAAAWEALSLPFDFLHYKLEKKFGLSRQSVGSWIKDKLKTYALGAVLGGIALGLVYLAVTRFGEQWWLATSLFFILFSIGLAQLTPILLIPLFYPMNPMDPSPLKERLLALCRKFGVEVKDVYHLGLGEKTEKGNAAFVGLGRTKRILIGDTLYQKFPEDEVEAVFAHELGHQVHNDLWKGIALGAVSLVLGFFLADRLAAGWIRDYETSLARPSGLLIFFAALTIVQMPLGLVSTLFSRWREREADRFASETIGVGGPLGAALERLTFQNFSYFKPNALLEFFSYSHPAPWRRITRLRHQA